MRMRKSYIGVLAAAGAWLLLFALCFRYAPVKETFAATNSRAECVAEISSRRFLFDRNADVDLPMASTTKVLTAIIVIDDCSLDETISIPKEAEGVEGSSAYLRAGDEYTVRDLLYGLMLRSGNDCAETLALHHSGSIKAFAQAMNEKASSLGAEHSRFVNPHGLPAKGHYTTARDLALIAAYAMENETFREIVSCKYYQPRHWQNKNKMLWNYEGAIGVKTGFTVAAGRCLVTSAERDGMKLVCVVLNSPQMYERTAELLDEAFRSYRMVTLCDKSKQIEKLTAKEDFIYPLTAEEEKSVAVQIEKIQPQPTQKGEFAGQMKIFLKNDLLFSQNLYMI